MSDLVDKLPRWLAVQAHGDTVRLLPVDSPSSGPDVFCKLQAAADRIEQLESQLSKAESALELIATPKRPDGTWNRDREACRVLAAETLEALK